MRRVGQEEWDELQEELTHPCIAFWSLALAAAGFPQACHLLGVQLGLWDRWMDGWVSRQMSLGLENLLSSLGSAINVYGLGGTHFFLGLWLSI